MEITIERSTRMPTLLNGARTYKIICKMDGIYIICLGKATLRVKNVNIVSQAIVEGLLNSLDNKYEQKIIEKEKELMSSNLKDLSNLKGNFFIPKENIKKFSISKLSTGFLLLHLKENKSSVELHIHPCFQSQLENMKRMMGF